MSRIFTFALMLSFAMIGVTSFATAETRDLSQGPVMETNDAKGTASFQPCQMWQWVSGGNYSCSWVGTSITVYDANTVDSLIKTLEQRIADLEARVQRLESQH